jgi:cobalamin biosynthesis protein CobD/CbiB
LPSYECAPGAARRPLPTSYARRQPERLSLHEVVTEHLESFLEELARE